MLLSFIILMNDAVSPFFICLIDERVKFCCSISEIGQQIDEHVVESSVDSFHSAPAIGSHETNFEWTNPRTVFCIEGMDDFYKSPHSKSSMKSSLPKKSTSTSQIRKSLRASGNKSMSNAAEKSSSDYYSPKASTNAINQDPPKKSMINSPGESKTTPPGRSFASDATTTQQTPAQHVKHKHSFDLDHDLDYEYE